MPSAQDVLSDTVAAITERLAARHDGLAILHAVVDACASLLSANATGVLLVDPRGGLEVAAASDERARFVELLQAHAEEGPCVDCIAGNTAVVSVASDEDEQRWPRLMPPANDAGFVSIYAFPLRLMGRAVGGLNMFYSSRTVLAPAQLRLAQALADLAILGLTQERDQRRVDRLAEQTLTTINDRAHLGHALGVIAGTLHVPAEVARARLAAHSASTGRSMRELAHAVTSGVLAPQDLDGDRSLNTESG